MRDMLRNKQAVMLGALTLSGVTPNATDWVDTREFDACTLSILTGAVTDAGDAEGFTATMQHSDTSDAADAVDVVAGDTVDGSISLSVTADGDDNVIVGGLGYRGSKRYVRLNFVGTTGTDAVVNTVALLNKPHRAPTTFVGASVAAT